MDDLMEGFLHESDASREDKDRELEFRALMEMPLARKFIYDLIIECGVFGSAYTGNSNGIFREGVKSVGLDLISRMSMRTFASLILENEPDVKDSNK